MKNITVIGTGYVGLVAGSCLADFGHRVVCADIDPKKIDLLNTGKSPIYEPGLEELMLRNTQSERLFFSANIADSIKEADVVFIGVGTPTNENGEVDMSNVFSVAKTIAKHMSNYTVIVTKSTVPLGTAKKIEDILIQNGCKKDIFSIVSNPEFLREGSAIGDFMIPDRIVIGATNEKAFSIMRDVYQPLFLRETPIIETNPETAELIKYASNGFLATKISFINELAQICDKTNADILTVAKAMGLDGRISSKFLHAGPGYGGSCFPKDTEGLLQIANNVNVDAKITRATIATNHQQKTLMVDKIKSLMSNNLENKKITILGLTFKPKTDDIRESPAIIIISELLQLGARITAYDPEGIDNMKQIFPQLNYECDISKALTDADGAVLVTEWHELRSLDPVLVKKWMKNPNFLDCRNIYTPKLWTEAGMNFDNVGKK